MKNCSPFLQMGVGKEGTVNRDCGRVRMQKMFAYWLTLEWEEL